MSTMCIPAVRGQARPGRERGSYTAELAVALPALLLVVAWGLLAVGYADASLRCGDAARAGARAAARGEPIAAVEAASRHAAPEGADIRVVRGTERAEVRCSARVRLAGLPTIGVHARSVAVVEDDGGVAPAPPPATVTEGQ